MERLEKKTIKGKDYYYYSQWGWRDGKCRRLWQKYLGRLEDIVQAVTEGVRATYAEVFEYGLPTALWAEIERCGIVDEINSLCPKRKQGLSVGEYIAIASVNRAICPVSKMGMWEWFCNTVLRRQFPDVNEKMLSSKRFWDNMSLLPPEVLKEIWGNLIKKVIKAEKIDLSQICYDGTNFYTFISTFNSRCDLAQRGKNKQGRSNLRQVSYALFCTREGGIPLYYDVYEGNTADSTQFPKMVTGFCEFLGGLAEDSSNLPGKESITVIFDKGNNSADNIKLLDKQRLNFVGSLKLNEHKDLTQVSNRDSCLTACSAESLQGMKAFSVTKKIHGKERKIVVMFNQKLFDDQFATLNNDIRKALGKLAEIKQRLDDRRNGLIKGGRVPTTASVTKQADEARKRQYLKGIIEVKVEDGRIPTLNYEVNSAKLDGVIDTSLGKKLLITTRLQWDDDDVIEAYHSQYVIEHLFRGMKGSHREIKEGVWWPLNHWTNQKIQVHGLYSTVAVLLRSLLQLRAREAGLKLSPGRLMRELADIREVVNIQQAKGRRKERRSTVLTKLNQIQTRLLQDVINSKLG